MALRTPLRRRPFGFLFAAGMLVASLAAGCSENAEDMSDGELRTRLIEVLTEDGSLTSEQATCVVDGLFEQAPRDQINRMANAETEDELTEEDTNLMIEVVLTCL